MIRKITVFTGLIPLFLLSCAGLKEGKSSRKAAGIWQSQPIVIDGDNKDWPSPYPNYDVKSRTAYASSNDKKNLYLTIETGDEMTQLKILSQGMTVSIDTNGRRSGQFYINYPLKNDNTPLVPVEELSMRKETLPLFIKKQHEQQISKLMQEANQFSLEGFRDCNSGYLVSQTTECGIKVKARIDEYDNLVWEAAIPFKAIFNKDTVSKSDAGKPISVSFTIRGLYNPSAKNRQGNAGSQLNSGMAGMGGHEQQQANRNTAVQGQYLYETTKTWKVLGIAISNQVD